MDAKEAKAEKKERKPAQDGPSQKARRKAGSGKGVGGEGEEAMLSCEDDSDELEVAGGEPTARDAQPSADATPVAPNAGGGAGSSSTPIEKTFPTLS